MTKTKHGNEITITFTVDEVEESIAVLKGLRDVLVGCAATNPDTEAECKRQIDGIDVALITMVGKLNEMNEEET